MRGLEHRSLDRRYQLLLQSYDRTCWVERHGAMRKQFTGRSVVHFFGSPFVAGPEYFVINIIMKNVKKCENLAHKFKRRNLFLRKFQYSIE
ncbi:hypothetical protein RclHR1_11860006 [Rhizophagus clarus]|nr:hypothetical protein RclHR1_11860006 [Rhizophagus clarus]